MFNSTQMNPLNFFSPYFDRQNYSWPQIPFNYRQLLENINAQKPSLPKNSNCTVKIEAKEQLQPQKPEYCIASDNLHLKMENQSLTHKKKSIRKQKNQPAEQEEIKIIQRNETKNISKNFGKAILAFAKTHTQFSEELLKQHDVERQFLINYIKKARRNLNSLQDLRQMWGADHENDRLKKCLRIISFNFMRKHCLCYIFNSRIKSVSAHTKYRHRLIQGMVKPSQFVNIKQN